MSAAWFGAVTAAAQQTTTYRVFGYGMFATTAGRDFVWNALLAWLLTHTTQEAWPSTYTINVGGSPYVLPQGIQTPDLMDLADPPTGPWPGLTWSYQTATAALRDSFGDMPNDAGAVAEWTNAMEGSQFGEQTYGG